jgi:hypothetical protein
MNLEVQLHFFHDPRGLRIEVRSTALLTAEEHRIRRRLTAGMGYEDLVQFYRTHGDRSEGEGLGLAMVLLLYRAEGLNPHLFRIGVVDGETLARLEVPLSPNFVSVRGADPAGLIARG